MYPVVGYKPTPPVVGIHVRCPSTDQRSFISSLPLQTTSEESVFPRTDILEKHNRKVRAGEKIAHNRGDASPRTECMKYHKREKKRINNGVVPPLAKSGTVKQQKLLMKNYCGKPKSEASASHPLEARARGIKPRFPARCTRCHARVRGECS